MHGKEVSAVMSSDFWAFAMPAWWHAPKPMDVIVLITLLAALCYMGFSGRKSDQ